MDFVPISFHDVRTGEQFEAANPVVSVLSFNICRDDLTFAGLQSWDRRSAPLAALIRSHKPDLILLQEVTPNQIFALDPMFRKYERAGKHRPPTLHRNPIYYDSSVFDCIGSDFIELPGFTSRSRGDSVSRSLNRATLVTKATGLRIEVGNTHLDPSSRIDRLAAARILVDRMPPGILAGDFNEDPRLSQVFKTLQNAGWQDVMDTWEDNDLLGPQTTWSSPDRGGSRRPDWVLCKFPWAEYTAQVGIATWEGTVTSDHRPTVANIIHLSWEQKWLAMEGERVSSLSQEQRAAEEEEQRFDDLVDAMIDAMGAERSTPSAPSFTTARKTPGDRTLERMKPEFAGTTDDPQTAALFQRLRDWRRTQAHLRSVPAYVIARDRALWELAQRRPQSPLELGGIPGVGSAFRRRYGEQILAMIKIASGTDISNSGGD